MIEIKGVKLSHVLYSTHNPEKPFSIFKVVLTNRESQETLARATRTPIGQNHLIVINSYSPALIGILDKFKDNPNDFDETYYDIKGKITFNKQRQTWQMELESYIEAIPCTEEGMIAFLSKYLPKIGSSRAKKIVNHFGVQNIITEFDNDVSCIKKVHGINFNDEEIEEIGKEWTKFREYFKFSSYIAKYEIKQTACESFFLNHKENSIAVFQRNPYLMCFFDGVNFAKMDKIALEEFKIGKYNEKRIHSAISYVLKKTMTRFGHTMLDINDYVKQAMYELKFEKEDDRVLVVRFIQKNISQGRLFLFEQKIDNKVHKFITNKSTYEQEKQAVENVLTMIENMSKKVLFSEAEIEAFIANNPNRKMPLDESQLRACVNFFNHPFCIISGGPGTGKSTTLNAIVDMYHSKGKTVLALAPTAKAAQRIYQTTGLPSQTIHLALKLSSVGGSCLSDFLDADLLLVDECSMMDSRLFYYLMEAINAERTAVLMVGDFYQLEPVGTGFPFRDLLESKLIPTSFLEINHRISPTSSAAQNGINIRDGLPIDLNTTDDFEFIEISDESKISDKVEEIFFTLLNQNIDVMDIQILSPVNNRGACSVNAINDRISRTLFPPVEDLMGNYELDHFVTGAKVMQIENDYDRQVFNGDTGIIVNPYDYSSAIMGEINHSDIYVKFLDGKVIGYSLEDRKKYLTLAYALTVHKSQGSDYAHIIVPISKENSFSWRRKLLYTAVTRAKTKVWIIGDKYTLLNSYINNKEINRNTVMKSLFHY